ncbi:MAG: hypothetical protein Q9198_004549 [Flavoplaca austrocitrina]
MYPTDPVTATPSYEERAPAIDLVPAGFVPPSSANNKNFPRGDLTRTISLALLATAYASSITCLIVGGVYFNNTAPTNPGWRRLRLSRPLKQSLPLLINIFVTILTEGTGYVHAVALRWSLGTSLVFNSNLRLFSSIRGSWAFGRLMNFLSAGFLVLCYAATGLIFATLPPENVCSALPLNFICDERETRDLVFFRPGAVLALGIGLLGSSALATWQVVDATVKEKIKTWSSSPIETAWAAWSTGLRTRREGRCMLGVHEQQWPSAPTLPRQKQGNAWEAHTEVRRVVAFLWVLVLLTLFWFVGVIAAVQRINRECIVAGDGQNYMERCDNVYVGGSWSLLPDTNGVTSLAQISLVNDASGGITGNLSNNGAIAVVFILMMGFQSVITMGLHCSELLVTLSRDQDTWRRATSAYGCKERNALLTVLGSWKSIALLALKPLVHWLFGLAMSFYVGWGIFMRPPQILYLCLSTLILAGFGTWLTFAVPRGPQPAAYGHLQTMIDLIDDWGQRMFWGHKGWTLNGFGHAGTSSQKCEEVRMELYYAGNVSF